MTGIDAHGKIIFNYQALCTTTRIVIHVRTNLTHNKSKLLNETLRVVSKTEKMKTILSWNSDYEIIRVSTHGLTKARVDVY